MTWADFAPVLAVLRGGERTDPAAAAWVEHEYGVPVIDVVEDEMVTGRRLTVWFHTAEEVAEFRTMPSGNYDPVRQEAIAIAAGRPGIFVNFRAADDELRRRTLEAVPVGAYEATAKATLDDPTTVWRVYPLLGQVFVMLQTIAQADALRTDPAHVRLVDALWELIRAHDEFGVIPRSSFDPVIDSKQVVDEDFAGSTYYYHR